MNWLLGRCTKSSSLLIDWKADYVNLDVGKWINVVVRIFYWLFKFSQ